ncbi:MAG TPA: hypothetical protein VFO07_14275 [Roseiflexaceae bacterium]|nr:hypothetical protein [Roseiflexaceae bacterium]HEU5098418.1 hypothetical protein [Roseiflexaceae bacterium]
MNTRMLGVAGMVGGLALLAVEIRELLESGSQPDGTNIDRIDSVGSLIWGLGMALAMWALSQLGATGRGRIARAIPLIALVGFVIMAGSGLIEALGLVEPINDPLAGPAWILLLIGTLATGIMALVARTLPGWRRFTPLLCILTVPPVFLLGPAAGPLFGVSWILLGLAVATSGSDVPAADPTPVSA